MLSVYVEHAGCMANAMDQPGTIGIVACGWDRLQPFSSSAVSGGGSGTRYAYVIDFFASVVGGYSARDPPEAGCFRQAGRALWRLGEFLWRLGKRTRQPVRARQRWRSGFSAVSRRLRHQARVRGSPAQDGSMQGANEWRGEGAGGLGGRSGARRRSTGAPF
jgi:hypothetical protein